MRVPSHLLCVFMPVVYRVPGMVRVKANLKYTTVNTVLESYTHSASYVGSGHHYFDPFLKKWRQTWTDSGGGTGELTGDYKDGALRYEGEAHDLQGTRKLTRGAFFHLGPGQTRQIGEQSTDDGKTWQVQFEFTYTRKKPYHAAR